MNVRIVTNARNYAWRMSTCAKLIDPALEAAMMTAGKDALIRARELSSGPFGNPKVLAALGHPYSVRQPRVIGREWPATVNINTGRFREGWYFRVRHGVTKAGNASILVEIGNTAPEAKYLTSKGTVTMIGRPLLEQLLASGWIQQHVMAPSQTAYGKVLRVLALPLPGDVIPTSGPSTTAANTVSGMAASGTSPASVGSAFAEWLPSFAMGVGLGFAAGTAAGRAFGDD